MMIYLTLFVSIIGWVLGLGLITQAKVQGKVQGKVQANKITEYDFKSHYPQEDAAPLGHAILSRRGAGLSHVILSGRGAGKIDEDVRRS